MKSRRYSLAWLMIAVAVCGLGMAALREESMIWAAVMRTLAVVLVLGAAIGAFARKGRTKYAWAGFAVFGFVAHGPLAMLNLADLLPEHGISLVEIHQNAPQKPVPGAVFNARIWPRSHIDHACGAILFAVTGAMVGSLVYREDGKERDDSSDQVHRPPDLSS